MAFKQGNQPCLLLDREYHSMFRGTLFKSGYQIHQGLRTMRENEIQAWVRSIGRGRQVHVQEVKRDQGRIAVFAHTEPEGYGLDHIVSALFDGASFQGGAKALKSDLRNDGWRFRGNWAEKK